METLITDKLNKEANRYVAHWQEEQIAIENGRWGPFIRFKKESIPFPKTNGERMTPEQAAQLSLEAVKALIVEKIPDAFQKPAAKKKKVKQQSVSKK